jgi:hypothetical protein
MRWGGRLVRADPPVRLFHHTKSGADAGVGCGSGEPPHAIAVTLVLKRLLPILARILIRRIQLQRFVKLRNRFRPFAIP